MFDEKINIWTWSKSTKSLSVAEAATLVGCVLCASWRTATMTTDKVSQSSLLSHSSTVTCWWHQWNENEKFPWEEKGKSRILNFIHFMLKLCRRLRMCRGERCGRSWALNADDHRISTPSSLFLPLSCHSIPWTTNPTLIIVTFRSANNKRLTYTVNGGWRMMSETTTK